VACARFWPDRPNPAINPKVPARQKCCRYYKALAFEESGSREGAGELCSLSTRIFSALPGPPKPTFLTSPLQNGPYLHCAAAIVIIFRCSTSWHSTVFIVPLLFLCGCLCVVVVRPPGHTAGRGPLMARAWPPRLCHSSRAPPIFSSHRQCRFCL
jgi:hypothetical protein